MTGLDTLLYELCVDSPIQFTVSDVRYSNTGNTDTIDIRIDDQLAWSYNTLPTADGFTCILFGSAKGYDSDSSLYVVVANTGHKRNVVQIII
jgi:hypothetical protein